MNLKYSVREIVESAMLVALAIVLDLKGLKIPLGNSGGSISLNMLPLIILVLRVGPLKGFIGCGLIFGLITCLIDNYGFQYFPFDYLLGFGALSVIGFFNKYIFDIKHRFRGLFLMIFSIVIACSLRFVFSTISGVLFAEVSFVESMAYNALPIFLSCAACVVTMILLYNPIQLINKKFPSKAFD